MEDKKTSFTANFNRIYQEPRREPTIAHKFLFSAAGTDVLLEVGRMDLNEVHDGVEAIKAGRRKQDEPFTITIVGSYSLSLDGAEQMLETATAILEHLKKQAALKSGK